MPFLTLTNNQRILETQTFIVIPALVSINTGAIDVKMDGSVLEEKTSFKILGLTFSSKLDWGSYIVSIAKMCGKCIMFVIMYCGVCKKYIIFSHLA